MNTAALFRAKGLKVTPQRRTVYNVLDNLRHASVEEIVENVARKNADITVATIYNILDTFAASDIISRLSTPRGKLFYDITPATHHHIFADEAILDYNNDNLNNLLNEHFRMHPLAGYQIEKLSLQIYTTTNQKN